MITEVKEIHFDKKRAKNNYFDLVDLEDILRKTPESHSQFEHHKVSFYVILIITENNGKHAINFKDYAFKKGSVFNLRKNSLHKFYESDAKGKLLVFTEDFIIRSSDKIEKLTLLQLFNEMLGSPKLQLDKPDFLEIESLLHQIKKEFLTSIDNFSIEIIRSLTQVLILHLIRIKSKKNYFSGNSKYHTKFLTLHGLIDKECFINKKVSYYANEMGVTTKSLNIITNKVIGKRTKSFIDEVVIFKIKGLILNNQGSYSEIAYQVGFNDPTNFFKYFKKRTGLTPKQFKENSK